MLLNERVMGERARARGTTGVAEDPDDSAYGPFMFFVFLGSVLTVTGMVCVLAVVVEWWMLAVAVAIMLGLTAVVMAVLLGALGTTADSYPDLKDAVPVPAPVPTPRVVRPLRPVGLGAHHASAARHR